MKSTDNLIVSDLSRPMAMDDFDIDIIDLSFADIWKYEGTTLLQIFELFQRGEIDSERCREVFKTQIGLLKIEDVKK